MVTIRVQFGIAFGVADAPGLCSAEEGSLRCQTPLESELHFSGGAPRRRRLRRRTAHRATINPNLVRSNRQRQVLKN